MKYCEIKFGITRIFIHILLIFLPPPPYDNGDVPGILGPPPLVFTLNFPFIPESKCNCISSK